MLIQSILCGSIVCKGPLSSRLWHKRAANTKKAGKKESQSYPATRANLCTARRLPPFLRELRIEANDMTQEQVAERSGYTPQYISYLEQRKYTPTIAAFGEIARSIGTIGVNQAWERLSNLLLQFAHLEVMSDTVIGAIDQDASTDTDRDVRRRIQAMLRKCTGERLLQAYERVKLIVEP